MYREKHSVMAQFRRKAFDYRRVEPSRHDL